VTHAEERGQVPLLQSRREAREAPRRRERVRQHAKERCNPSGSGRAAAGLRDALDAIERRAMNPEDLEGRRSTSLHRVT
jgi:hypothetical protein